MLRSLLGKRRGKGREGGQILVLFELCLIVMLLSVAMVIDLGFLRNNKQILRNTVDAAALAGGSQLPVIGVNGDDGPTTAQGKLEALIAATIKVDYPGLSKSVLPGPDTYQITYKCLIGVDSITGQPRIGDVPTACDPRNSLAHSPVVAGDFKGAGPTRSSDCYPKLGDKCNVVVVGGNSTTRYAFAPIGGVNSGSSGTVSSVACKGPCGASLVVPVDAVIILDRTLSMSMNDYGTPNKITSLKNAAKAVLSVYDPAKQRVALGLTGPSKINPTTGAPVQDTCGYGTAADAKDKSTHTTLNGAVTNSDTTITVNTATGLAFPTSGPFTILIDSEQMTVQIVTAVTGGFKWTVIRNPTTKAAHSSGVDVYGVDPWTPSATTVGMWVPVGLSGTDTNAVRALPNPSGAAGTYEVGGTPSTSSDIVKAINCISAVTDATDLATPIKMAQWYLDNYGRKDVTQGIILETDGHPQYGFLSNGPSGSPQLGTNASYTCQAAIDAATAAKADKTNSADGIQIFTIGYGVDDTVHCPTTASSLSVAQNDSNNISYNMSESATWSNALATTMLKTMATDALHYKENPSSSDLAAVFTQAAIQLVQGGAHLIQICPAPIVGSTSAGSWASGATVTITGSYFTGANAAGGSVRLGGAAATAVSVTDTSISAKATAAGSGGATVTTACGSGSN